MMVNVERESRSAERDENTAALRARRFTLNAPRSGLTLLEVLVAMAIFLFSITAISHLLTVSGDRALAAQLRTQASLRGQSKLAEVVAGIQPLSSSGWAAFDDNPDWSWQLNCTQEDVANLWKVQVAVKRQRGDGSTIEVNLNQLVLDPGVRGSSLVDVATTTASSADAGGAKTSSSGANSGASGSNNSSGSKSNNSSSGKSTSSKTGSSGSSGGGTRGGSTTGAGNRGGGASGPTGGGKGGGR